MKFKYALIFILLIIFEICLLNKGFYSISADEAGHTIDAWRLYRGDYSLYSLWLPFMKVFFGLLFHLNPEIFWFPRIVSMLFSCGLVYILMMISKELFNEQTAVLTGYLSISFIGVVVFGVLPLTEIYFFFFLVLSIYLFVRLK